MMDEVYHQTLSQRTVEQLEVTQEVGEKYLSWMTYYVPKNKKIDQNIRI